MRDFRSTDERNKAAAYLTSNMKAACDGIWEAEITEGILGFVREIEQAKTRAFKSARPSLEWNAKWQPKSLLQAQIR
jgi:hypothetical protein